MGAKDESERKPDAGTDDLVERARQLEKRAEELAEEEAEVEELEQGAKKWLEHEPKHYWPPLEDDDQGDDA